MYELTDYNFEEAVLHCDEMWVVNFYSAWAKLCVKFFPVFQKAATELKGRGVKFGGYDLSAEEQFQQKYNVSFCLSSCPSLCRHHSMRLRSVKLV